LVGSSLLESDATSTSQQRIAYDANGNGFALWAEGSDVIVRRYDRSTDSWGTATVIDGLGTTVSSPDLAVDAQGNAVAAWVQSDGTAQSLYASRYDAATHTWSAPQSLESSSTAVGTTAGSVSVAINGSVAAVGWSQNVLYAAIYTGGAWADGNRSARRAEVPRCLRLR